MALLELLMSIGMIIAAMANLNEDWIGEIPTMPDYNLSDNIKPTHYDIQLVLPIEEDVYSGESIISIKIYENTRHIELHSANLVVTKAELISESTQTYQQKRTIYKPMKYSYYSETKIFIINFSNEILAGNYILTMKFLGKANKNTEGLFRTSYKERGNTMWLFATYLRTTGARYLFPCWDNPALKAEFTISIKHPKKYKALSNMPPQNRTIIENGMMWTYFSTTPLISPHFIEIVIIGFMDDYINNDIINYNIFDQLNIKVWFREATHYNSDTYATFQYLVNSVNKYWHMYTYKLIPKADYVAIPDLPEKVITTWGLVIYREKDIFYMPNHLTSKFRVKSLIIYNILMESLSGLPSWLKEGFANFIDVYSFDEGSSANEKMDFYVVQKQHESLYFNFQFNNKINKLDINSLPHFLRYNKAFSLLRMLYHLLTDEVFRLGVKIYLQKNSGSMTSSDMFWKSMQNAVDQSYPHNDIIILAKMKPYWTKQKNYPILKLTRNSSGHASMSLENPDSFDDQFWVPMTHTTQKNPDFSKITIKDIVFLKYSKKMISRDVSKYFKEDGWIIINLQQSGYYRVNYDTENWRKIAMYLNSKEYKKIHALNRAQIIDDAYHFLTTEQIDSSVFWKITEYIYRDRNFLPWYPMFKILERISSVLPLSDKRTYYIKEKMQKIFSKYLTDLPYESLDMSMPLVHEMMKWTCIVDCDYCKTMATSFLQQHLLDDKKYLLSEEWIFCNGLAMSSVTIWEQVLNIYTEKLDNKYLRFLACSENISIIRKFIMLVMDDKIIRQIDRMSSFQFIIAKHAKNSIILDYIFANFKKIVPSEATLPVLTDIINHVYSTEHLHKIHQFTKDYSNELSLYIHRKIKIRLSQIKSQMDYLRILTR